MLRSEPELRDHSHTNVTSIPYMLHVRYQVDSSLQTATPRKFLERLLGLLLLWLLLLGRGLDGLDWWVLVLGSDLDRTLWLGLDEVDGVWKVLGGSLSALWVVGLHAVTLSARALNYEANSTHILTLIPKTPCRRRTCRTA